MDNVMDKVIGKSIGFFVAEEIPKEATLILENEIVEGITPKKVVRSIDVNGEISYHDIVGKNGEEEFDISKQQFYKILNSKPVTVRRYKVQYLEYEGIIFAIDTLGVEKRKMVSVIFENEEAEESFAIPNWLVER